jgi:hypothetical protein
MNKIGFNQKHWRGAIIRMAYRDPDRDYWIECMDEEQGDDKYYFNTWTSVTSWKAPFVYKVFGMGRAGNRPDDI